MKTSTSKRNVGHFFFKSREDQRAFASKSGKEKRDQGTDAPRGKRWSQPDVSGSARRCGLVWTVVA